VTLFAITQRERAGWQRRAAVELVRILGDHRDLPVIAWTVGSAGATLVGHVNGLQPGVQVRAIFDIWRGALALTEHSEFTSAGAVTYLRAVAHRNRVQVGISATVLDDEGEG
jgi:hypothetical protein